MRPNEEEETLHQVLKGVQNLHEMSIGLGQKINKHDDLINTIENKTETTSTSTLGVMLRTAQLSLNAHKVEGKFIGCFQFFHEASGKYLNTLDEDIVLYHKKERTSYFHVYQKHDNIMALQSVMTR